MATKTKKPPAAAAEAAAQTTEKTIAAAPAAFAGYGDWADLGRENVAAVIKANAALSQGIEVLSKEFFGCAKIAFESVTHTTAALLGAKTFEDVVQLNTAFAKASLESMLSNSAKLSELGVQVANEALAPLGGRIEATLAKLTKPIAA
jgi:phasin family protein